MYKKFPSTQKYRTLREFRRDRLSLWHGSYPQVSEAAAYYELSQHIELYDIDEPMMSAALAQDLRAQLRVWPTVVHELRHFFDHICTLWGQRNLVTAVNAIHAWNREDEAEYWRILDYRRQTYKDRFATYFTTMNDLRPPVDDRDRWLWQLSSGVAFDVYGRPNEDRPIAFTRFSWADGRLACRVPFSVSALLETNAMASEMTTAARLIQQLPAGEMEVERGEFTRSYRDRLYNPELAVYSTAAHCLANNLQLVDSMEAYNLSSCIACLSLNLPDAWFDLLNIPTSFTHWGARTRAFVEQRDCGFAYLVLATNAVARQTGQSMEDWCSAVLAASNLPSMDRLKVDCLAEMRTIPALAIQGQLTGELFLHLTAGQRLLEEVGPVMTASDIGVAIPRIAMPPLILSDMAVVTPNGKSPEGLAETVEARATFAFEMERKFQEFAAACAA